MSTSPSGLQDPAVRAAAIASTAPFNSWPEPAVHRLARSSHVVKIARGATVVAAGEALESIVLVADGVVQASASAVTGRRFTFTLARPARVYGLIGLVDGNAMTTDIVAVESTEALHIPAIAIREELVRDPTLWKSVAIELATRSRSYIDAFTRQLFDSPRARLARLLVTMAAKSGEVEGARIMIRLRLTQEHLGEMLGVSRQTTTALIREMTAAGLIEWRYGRAIVIDLKTLREIAEGGIGGT